MKTLTCNRNSYLYKIATNPFLIWRRDEPRDLCTYIRMITSGFVYRLAFAYWVVGLGVTMATFLVLWGYSIYGTGGWDIPTVDSGWLDYVAAVMMPWFEELPPPQNITFTLSNVVNLISMLSLATWMLGLIVVALAICICIFGCIMWAISEVVKFVGKFIPIRHYKSLIVDSSVGQKVTEVNEVVHEKFCAFIKFQ